MSQDILSSKQQQYWREADHRWNVKEGATRSGKTYLDYFVIPKRLKAGHGKEGLNVILGNTRETVRRNIIVPMQGMYGAQRVSDIKAGDNSCMMFGEKVYVLGADNITHVDRLRGASIKYCYGDEIVTWAKEVFEMLKSRMDKSYSIFDGTCNPDSPQHWFYHFLESDADIYRQNYTLFDNPFLPASFVENLQKEYEGTVLYDRYIMGLWVASDGALFTTYPAYTDNEKMLQNGIAHIDAAYGGEDFTAFTCCKKVKGKDGSVKLYIYGKLWRQHVDTVLDRCLADAQRLMCAPIYCEDNGDKGFLGREIRNKGFYAHVYTEHENKYVKISTYLRKWWPNVVFLSGTDKAYIQQIMSYTDSAEHDDAPDSAACCVRLLDRR